MVNASRLGNNTKSIKRRISAMSGSNGLKLPSFPEIVKESVITAQGSVKVTETGEKGSDPRWPRD